MYKQHLTRILKNAHYRGIINCSLLNDRVGEGKREKLILQELFLASNGIIEKSKEVPNIT